MCSLLPGFASEKVNYAFAKEKKAEWERLLSAFSIVTPFTLEINFFLTVALKDIRALRRVQNKCSSWHKKEIIFMKFSAAEDITVIRSYTPIWF